MCYYLTKSTSVTISSELYGAQIKENPIASKSMWNYIISFYSYSQTFNFIKIISLNETWENKIKNC